MTKKYLYAVNDIKAKAFDGYMILENDAQAVRAFAQACEKNEVFNKWPEDFQIFRLAEIHTELGVIVPEEKPVFLAAALSFIEKKSLENKNEQTSKNNK